MYVRRFLVLAKQQPLYTIIDLVCSNLWYHLVGDAYNLWDTLYIHYIQ